MIIKLNLSLWKQLVLSENLSFTREQVTILQFSLVKQLTIHTHEKHIYPEYQGKQVFSSGEL